MSLIFLIPTAKEMQENIPNSTANIITPNADILQELAKFSTDELSKKYKVSQTIAEKEKKHIALLEQKTADIHPALLLFNGLMYRNINRENLTPLNIEYIKQHIFITSALYGIIPAYAGISPHRLDFNVPIKIDKLSLKNFWRENYNNFLKEENTYISLLSSEFENVFSPVHQKQLHTIKFLENKSGVLKSHSTISKKARGQFLNHAIKENCLALSDIKKLSFNEFYYSTELSTENQSIFVKFIKN